MGGVIVRNALTEREQQWLYQYLYKLVDHESEEIGGLRATARQSEFRRLNPDNRPQPFVTWVHPYTRQSNARERPTHLLEWAQQLMHSLASASRGGDLGLFGPGEMVPQFDEVAFSLGEDAMSDVVETPFGYHVIWRLG